MDNLSFLSKYQKKPDAWQTKFQEKIGLPFPIPWIIVGIGTFMFGFALKQMLPAPLMDLRMVAILSALVAAIANSVVYYENILDRATESIPHLLREDADGIERWLDKWYGYIFWSSRNVYSGVLLCIVCIVSIYFSGGLGRGNAGAAFGYVMIGLIGFLGGSMFWTMIGIAKMTSSLGSSVKIRASIFDSQTSTLKIASGIIWRVAITAAVVYLLGVSMYPICGVNLAGTIYVIVIGFGAFIFIYFIAPQVNIHNTLLELKRDRLRVLVVQIDKTFDRVADDPTLDNIGQLRDLFNLQKTLNGKAAWAFGTKELLSLLGSVLIPLIVIVINRLLGK